MPYTLYPHMYCSVHLSSFRCLIGMISSLSCPKLFDFPYKRGLPLDSVSGKDTTRCWSKALGAILSQLSTNPKGTAFRNLITFSPLFPSSLHTHPPKHLHCSPSQLVYTIIFHTIKYFSSTTFWAILLFHYMDIPQLLKPLTLHLLEVSGLGYYVYYF